MPEPLPIAEVVEMVRPVAKVPAEAPIGADDRLVDDLNIDSLDLVGVFLQVQDRFGVEVADDDVPGLRRVADLAAYIAARRPAAA